VSTRIQTSPSQSGSLTQDSQGNPYASRFAAVANKLGQMQPDELKTTLASIGTQSPALATRLASYLKLSPADQQAELAKMRAVPTTGSVPDLITHLEALTPIKQTTELRRIAQTDAKLAATLRHLLALPGTERQQAIEALLQGSNATPAATTPVAAGHTPVGAGHPAVANSLLPGDGIDHVAAGEVARAARAQAAQMIATTRNSLMDMLGASSASGGAGHFDSADGMAGGANGLAGMSQQISPMPTPAQTKQTGLAAYARSVGARGI
jgi:hypothetical protein